MQYNIIALVIGFILIIIGLCMIIPLGFSFYYHESVSRHLGISSIICMCFGLVLVLIYKITQKERHGDISYKEGMAVVTLAWIFASLFGALPFYISGYIPSYIDSFFETMSGFTTTGASILRDIEALPRGLLLWRSFTHFLGGMGIIVLSLAILPFFNIAGMQLYKAEVPGPTPDKLRPRLKDTAIILWKVYLLLTAIETILLMSGGMDLFEALCHSFGTMATGGFSTKNQSIGYYSSFNQIVIIIFMYLAGLNFSHHYKFLQKDFRSYFKDPEFFLYTGVIFVMVLLITPLAWNSTHEKFSDALLHSSFQTISILTTTGYATFDYEKWHYLAQALLFLAMFIGGCAGSTGGGIKCIRIILLFKIAAKEFKRLIHPRAVVMVKLRTKKIPQEICNAICVFFFLYFLVFFVSVVFLSCLSVDLLTSISATVACLGNIGPGFGYVGPTENYSQIPKLGKIILSFCMVAGRLEIYPVLIFFYPEFWKK